MSRIISTIKVAFQQTSCILELQSNREEGMWFSGSQCSEPVYTGSWSSVTANWKSVGNSSCARGYINLYECLMVTSATPAMSPISAYTHPATWHYTVLSESGAGSDMAAVIPM